jgi:ABC-type nitrate/sulfonate/bicarbonate transport system substrate-binding protein
VGTFFASTFIIGAASGAVSTIGISHGAARATGVVARPDSGVKTLQDLKGKKIGGSRAASTNVILEIKLLPKAGLSKNDYTWVPLKSGGADSLGAMLAKTIDAYASSEPYVSLAVEKANAVVVADFGTYDPMHIFIGVPTVFAESNPDSYVALLKGWRKAADIWNNEKEKTFEIVKSFLAGGSDAVSDPVLHSSIDRLDVKPTFDKSTLIPYLDESADLELKANNIPAKPNWDKALRFDIWEKSLKA